MKHQKRYLIVILSFLLTVCFQKASISQVNISGIVNQYTAVTAITQPACAPCDVACIHTITVTDGSLFQPGDKALIIQMKGATINTANTVGSGDVTAINNAGNYEFFVVGSVVGNLLTPAYPLIRNYTVSGKVQVVRIPQFADNVNITGTLTAQDWNEVTGTGGVVAIEAKKVTFNAGIDVLGQGYKGIQMLVNGTPDNCTPGPTTLFNVSSATNSSYTKGDGIVLDNAATNRGRAPRANGGGSGISGDSGGGGGSNYGAGGEGGKRWCDIDGANAGGIGGFAMTTYLAQNKVFLGGAGGPGFVTTNNPSNAANGGGIVIIFADTIVGNGNTINARGTSPVAINPVGAPDGGGGGGAGGSVVLKTEIFVGNITVNVSGGDGQDLNTTTPHGPGGGGGGGVLLYSLASLPAGLTLNTAGGIGGEHLAGASSIRNGSQDGSAGGSISLYVPIQNPNYQGNVDNDVIPVSCDIDDDNDGIPDVVEAYNGDHDSDGTLDYMDADFCGATFQGVNGWDCATMGLPDPSGDMDGDLIPNYMDANFPTCGGLISGGICANFDADGDGNPVHLDLDSDNDGIPDLIEAGGVDTNGDGQVDTAADLDGDGLANVYDNNDTDGPTGTSPCAPSPNCLLNTSTSLLLDTDANGSNDFTADFDNDGFPNFADLDSDNDGITDVIEANGIDTNNDGIADSFVDIDNDGFNDVVDGEFVNCTTTGSYIYTPASLAYATANGPGDVSVTNPANALGQPLAADFALLNSTGDIATLQIANTITTGGTINLYISNPSGNLANTNVLFSSNGTTFTNTTASNIPAANTAMTMYSFVVPINTVAIRVVRTDNDDINLHGLDYTIPASILNTLSTSCITSNGTPLITTGADSDADGNPNSYVSGNSDADLQCNFIDIDSDNDGIVDNSEAQSTAVYIAPTGLDNDNDGIDNAYDANDGGTAIIPVNTDGTDNSDYLDLDADNDGLTDAIEGWDTDGNGIANTLPIGTDVDNDGLDDAYDVNDALVNPTNGTTPTSYPNVSISGTPERDWREVNPPTVTLTGTTSIAENAAGVATLTATLSVATTTATTITIGYTGTATNGTDYTPSSVTITIPAGSTTGTVTIDPTDDALFEGSETVIADITNVTGGNGATESGTQQATVTITDDEVAPTVTLSGTTSIAENAAGVATLTATLSVATTTATTITIGYTGTATNGTDYTPSSVTITIPAGSTTGTVTIDPTDDATSESSETVVADITNVTGGNGATESGTQTATVTITDDDTPNVSLSGTTTIAEDGVPNATLTLTLSVSSTQNVDVTLGYSGTATNGTDFALGTITVTIPAGSTTATFDIDPTSDLISEGNESVIIDITNVTGGNGASENGVQTATVTIIDNDAPTVTLSGTTSIAENAAGVTTLTATLSNVSTTATVVTITYTGTSVGADYVASSLTITIPAGSTTGTVTIDPTDDVISEGSETVIADITSVTGGNGAIESGTQQAIVTITDNDAPTVTLSGTTSIAENAAGVATLTATLSNVATTDVTVTIGYTGTAVGADYAASSVTITIPAGSTTGTVTIDPTDDVISEGSETVIADITSVTGGNGATESGTQTATVTITDNDAPTVTLSGTTSIAEDAAGVATLTATLSNVSTTATVVTVTYTGTAVGADYAASSVTITIPAGSTTGTVTIDPTDDVISEGSETVIADITSVTGGNGATESGTQQAIVTITDNDAPTVTLSGTTSIAEDAAGVATLTATLSNVSTTATVVTITYTGTAVGADYAASSVTITIPAGSTTGTVTVDPTDDLISEGSETVIADITSVTGGNGATESGTQQATVTITDNDAPTVTLSGTTSIAEDAAGVATLTATLSNASTTATVVTLTYTGTAIGADYVASSVTITIPAGSLTGTVTIDPTDDVISEGSETVIADITSVTGGNGATESGTQTATVTITDNDAPSVTLSGTTSIAEDAAGVVTLTATLSSTAPAATVVTLTYTGTAIGADYTASSVTITIPAGSLTGTVTVDPTDDLISEGSETVIADITSVTGGNGATESGTQTATVTITDNDAPTVTLSGTTSIAEDAAGVATLTATLSNVSTTATVVTLTYTGTAVGADYAASSVTITIPAGFLTGTVTIDPTDDVISEGSETVIADITSVTGGNGATESGTQQAIVTITDNDAPTVTLSGTTSIAEDAAGVATLTATLSNVSTTATVVTLTYTGTAVGADYAASSVTITIPAGSTTGTVTIDPTDDVISEGSETVIADITSVTGGNGATESGTQQAIVTITDNDAPTVTLSGTTSIAEDAAGVATLTATLSNVSTTATVVTLTYTGTAVGTDYAASSVTITIPAGSLTGTVTVDPTVDAVYEGPETVIADITSVTGGNGATESGTQQAIVTIIDVNGPPVAVDNSTSTNEDQAVTLSTIQSNDTDSDGTVIVGTIDLDPTQAGQQTTFTDAQGTWVLNTTTGDVIFTPAPNFNGTATIQYTIADNAGATSNSANLTVTVNPVNDAPIVDNEIITTNEDTPVSGDLTDAGDSDPDGTPLTVNTIPVDGPNNGTIVVNTDGTYTYTPNANYNGFDTVIVSVCDAGTPGISCVNDTIFITVNPVNDAPIVDNEIITTNEDTAVSGDLTDAGDSDPDGTPLTVNTTPVDGPNNGTIVVNADGTFTYTPNTNYNGLDTVIVSVCDAGTPGISCVNDTIFITVNPVNDSPIVDNEIITTNEDTPISGDLTDAGDSDLDGTPLTVNTTPVDGPNNGTIVVNTDGTYTYTPNPNYNGLDTVVVSVCDAGAPGIICINDTIYVTVNPVNDAPIVDNEIITTNEDTPVSGDLTNAGDSDVDGNLVVTTTPVDGPNNGTIVINPDGSYTYNPNPNYVGQDTIVVQICDDGTPTPVICVNDTIFITINPCSASDLLADCDQDGVTNGDEIDPDGNGTPGPNGTDPLNPCSFNLADQDFALVSATWLASDCDGDGVTNGEEVDPNGDGTPGPNGTNPSNPCDYDGTLQDFATVSSTWLTADCDGDGVTNGEEVDPDGDGTPGPNGTNPNDPCEFDLVTQDFTTVSSSWLAADCDGDGVTNGDEVDPDGDGTPGPNGTDINNPCDFASANATVAPSAAWLAADCDGDGVTNGEEIDPDGDGTPGPNGTNPNDPCDFDSALQDFAIVSTAWLGSDCDGDGVTNGDEVDPDEDGTPGPNGTNPNNPCEFDTVSQDFTTVSTAWLGSDCDGDGVTNGDEVDPDGDGTPGPNGTNPSDPCEFESTSQDFATVSTAWLGSDCDGDGVTNGDEVDPDGDGTPGPNGTDINNPCDFDFANATVAPSAGWLAADCDGDGVTNGEEIDPDGDGTPGPNGTNPNDPCEFDSALQDFATVSTAWLGSDCDGDGVTNGDEVDPDGDGTPGPNGTNPSDPCDFVLSDTTIAPSAAWLAADCDDDGVTNGDEVAGGSDPLNACSPKPCDLFIPQAFTPDGDGVNDNFVIEGIELFPDNEIVILNRWGNAVFQTTNYQNDWNGTSNSSLNLGNGDLPTGTYYYILDPKKEGYEVYKGYIYLQR